MSSARVTALGVVALASLVSLIIFVGMDLAGAVAIHRDIVTVLTGLTFACGLGYLAARVCGGIIARIDRLDSDQAEIRATLAAFAEAVSEFGDLRIAEARIDALRDLSPDAGSPEAAKLRSVGP